MQRDSTTIYNDLTTRGRTPEQIRRFAIARNDESLLALIEETGMKKKDGNARQGTLALTLIEKRLKNLDPECMRAKALVAVRDFRKSWVDVGRNLSEVARGGDYREWGYDDFESYCSAELGLKRPTVHKLLVSYQYMQAHQAKRLANGGDMPDYQTVAELDAARKAGQIDDAELQEIEVKVFSGETTDEREIRKKLRAASEEPKIPGMENETEKRRLIATARRLRVGLAQIGRDLFGDEVCERIEQALIELEETE